MGNRDREAVFGRQIAPTLAANELRVGRPVVEPKQAAPCLVHARQGHVDRLVVVVNVFWMESVAEANKPDFVPFVESLNPRFYVQWTSLGFIFTLRCVGRQNTRVAQVNVSTEHFWGVSELYVSEFIMNTACELWEAMISDYGKVYRDERN